MCLIGAQRPQTHSLLRSSLKPSTVSSYYTRPSAAQAISAATTAAVSRRQRTLDYASDTEATCPSSRSSYYYYRDRTPASGDCQ